MGGQPFTTTPMGGGGVDQPTLQYIYIYKYDLNTAIQHDKFLTQNLNLQSKSFIKTYWKLLEIKSQRLPPMMDLSSK